jgi:hypothetical protein
MSRASHARSFCYDGSEGRFPAGDPARTPTAQCAPYMARIEIEDVADVLEREGTLGVRSEEPLRRLVKLAAPRAMRGGDVFSKTSERVRQNSRHQPPERF